MIDEFTRVDLALELNYSFPGQMRHLANYEAFQSPQKSLAA